MRQQMELSTGLQMAALAHDLRTPMCVAAGAAQMALNAGGKDVSAQLRQILQAVSAMDRMLSMMSDRHEGEHVFTGAMLQGELLAMTVGKAEQKQQKLSIDLTALEGRLLEADYAAICRLLVNLLSNAIKYTQAGGVIALRAEMDDRHRYVRFIVSDNGMGMTRAFMGRMFLPYTRAQGTESIEGKGLGLSIAQDMVKRLGGRMRVHSQRGKGSTFIVSIPIKMRMGS